MYYAVFDNQGNRLASYHTDIHTVIPKEAMPITDEEQKLYATNEYVRGADGKPYKKPQRTPSTEELIAAIRVKRNKILAESDWTQLPDAPLSIEQKQVWKTYRQQLRDFPSTCDAAKPAWPLTPK